MLQLSLPTGQRLKYEGQETVEAKNKEFLCRARVYAKQHSGLYGYVSSDDVRAFTTSIGLYPTHHNCYGAIFKQKGWVCIGRKPSALATNHYREIRVWQWTGA